MGSGASKSAAQSTIRKFPNRAPGSAVPPSSQPSNGVAARAAAEGRAAERATPGRAANQRAAALSEQLSRDEGEQPAAASSEDRSVHKGDFDPQSSPPDTKMQPDLAQRLREIGVVQPNPTYSSSSTATPMSSPLQETQHSGPIFPSTSRNPVLSALAARTRIQEEADEEIENLGRDGRRYLHAGMIRDALVMRERGVPEDMIQHRLNLKGGVLGRLGPRGLYKPTGGAIP